MEKKKNIYKKETNNLEQMNSDKAYRNWNTFRYWFRGVAEFAPWVNKIFLVTDKQVPTWLNQDNEKIRVVDHTEIISDEDLPVFNSNAIEINIHKIKDLSENFVLFNDDMFITSLTKPSDFFVDNLPCDILALNPIYPDKGGTANFQVNNMEIINSYFSKKDIVNTKKIFLLKYKRNLLRTLLNIESKFVCGFYDPHLPYSLKKSTFEEIWNKESETLRATTKSKFREKDNVSVWLMRYWQLASGNFYPRNSDELGKLLSLTTANKAMWNLVSSKKNKVLCINDGIEIKNKEYVQEEFIAALDKILPNRCIFEKN